MPCRRIVLREVILPATVKGRSERFNYSVVQTSPSGRGSAQHQVRFCFEPQRHANYCTLSSRKFSRKKSVEAPELRQLLRRAAALWLQLFLGFFQERLGGDAQRSRQGEERVSTWVAVVSFPILDVGQR